MSTNTGTILVGHGSPDADIALQWAAEAAALAGHVVRPPAHCHDIYRAETGMMTVLSYR